MNWICIASSIFDVCFCFNIRVEVSPGNGPRATSVLEAYTSCVLYNIIIFKEKNGTAMSCTGCV